MLLGKLSIYLGIIHDNSQTWDSYPYYPLVNVYITMENHHFQWENSLFQWPFSIAFCNKLPEGITHHSNEIAVRPWKSPPRRTPWESEESSSTSCCCSTGRSQGGVEAHDMVYCMYIIYIYVILWIIIYIYIYIHVYIYIYMSYLYDLYNYIMYCLCLCVV